MNISDNFQSIDQHCSVTNNKPEQLECRIQHLTNISKAILFGPKLNVQEYVTSY